MKRGFLVVLLVALFSIGGHTVLISQQRQKGNQPERPLRPGVETAFTEPDKELTKLHINFVRDAEKLAKDYERKGDLERAIDVYREITGLVPQYEDAKIKLADLHAQLAARDKADITIVANKQWQDTGITVEPGKPISITATGKWTFNLSAELDPSGIPVPKELQEFNLGALIGIIDTGNREIDKPFMIGASKQFVPERLGRLYVQMHDNFHEDNEGSLKLHFEGAFTKDKK